MQNGKQVKAKTIGFSSSLPKLIQVIECQSMLCKLKLIAFIHRMKLTKVSMHHMINLNSKLNKLNEIGHMSFIDENKLQVGVPSKD